MLLLQYRACAVDTCSPVAPEVQGAALALSRLTYLSSAAPGTAPAWHSLAEESAGTAQAGSTSCWAQRFLRSRKRSHPAESVLLLHLSTGVLCRDCWSGAVVSGFLRGLLSSCSSLCAPEQRGEENMKCTPG